MGYEMLWPYCAYEEAGYSLSAAIRGYLVHGRKVTQAQYQSALAARMTARAAIAVHADKFDGFISPSSSGAAPAGLDYTGSRAFQAPWTVLGLPAFSLPLLTVDGLPVGVQLMGFDQAEVKLAAIAPLGRRVIGRRGRLGDAGHLGSPKAARRRGGYPAGPRRRGPSGPLP